MFEDTHQRTLRVLVRMRRQQVARRLVIAGGDALRLVVGSAQQFQSTHALPQTQVFALASLQSCLQLQHALLQPRILALELERLLQTLERVLRLTRAYITHIVRTLETAMAVVARVRG